MGEPFYKFPKALGLSNRPGSPSAPSPVAWLASMLIHLGLLLLLIIVLRRHAIQGVADQPSREVGIVLKQTTADGPRFEGEESFEEEVTEPADAAQTVTAPQPDPLDSLEDALPNEMELRNMQPKLPQAVSSPANVGLTHPVDFETNRTPGAAALTRGGKPNTRGGGPAHVGLFGVEGVGSKFVYLFDRSVSMEGALLAAAKRELIASLEALESVHQFQIIFFNYDVQIWDLTGGQQRIPYATERNKRLATRYVQGITAIGGTLRRKALGRALALRPEVVFFLTDTDNKMATGDVARAIRQAVRNSTTIHAIEFGFGPQAGGENFLTQLAHGTGGQYAYIDTSHLGR
jgi:hypothetical protein